MVITLIGYRGSGKSTLAVPLAKRLAWDWIDADVEIERRAGKSIREIFERDGEPVFRQWERDVIAELLTRPPLVLAAGGGAILDAETRAKMRNAGMVVWLRASIDTLLHRIETDPHTSGRRPNLTATGGREEVENLLARREPLYGECAHFVLDVENGTPEELAETVVEWWADWPVKGPPA